MTYEIYGSDSCAYCTQAINLLEAKGLEYNYIDFRELSGNMQTELMNIAGHQFRTVPQIFIEQHDEAILQLQIYYQNLWNNDNNALYNLLDTNKELNIGDIIEIPINISMKYNISNPWSSSLDNNEQRSVEGKWAFLYKFIIH